ncbi:unnamed protein product [Rhizophagus irregularis]|nr:unnamed protein product [Rhizophagus irregularis]
MQIIIITFQKNTSGYLIARQLTEQQQETVAAMIVVGTRPREILSTGLTNDAVQFNKFNVIVDHQSQGRGVRITKIIIFVWWTPTDWAKELRQDHKMQIIRNFKESFRNV